MLKIIVNNQEADIGSLRGITLQYNGGIFEFNSIEGSYSVPFNIPLSDKNREIFEYPYRTENVNDSIREYDVEIWHSGILMEEGTIKSKKFKNLSISCNIYISSGGFFKKLKEKKLNERDYGGYKAFTFKTEYSSTTDDFLLYEVGNTNFLKDTDWEAPETTAIFNETDEIGTPSLNVSDYDKITGWDKSTYPTLWFNVYKTDLNEIILRAYETEANRDNVTSEIFHVIRSVHTVVEDNSSGYGGSLTVEGVKDGDEFKVTYSISDGPYTYTDIDETGNGATFVSDYKYITGWDKETYSKLYFEVYDIISTILKAYLTEADRTAGTNEVFWVTEGTNVVVEKNSSGFGGVLVINGVDPTDKFLVTAAKVAHTQNSYDIVSVGPTAYGFYFHEFNPCIITPFPLLWRVLQYIFLDMGYIYTDTFFTQTYYKLINIFNVNNAVEELVYLTDRVKNYMNYVNLANHVPDMGTEEFIIAIQNFFNVFFSVKGNKVTVVDRKTMLSSTAYEDFNEKVVGDYTKELSDPITGYILRNKRDDNDEVISFFEDYGEYDTVYFWDETPTAELADIVYGDIIQFGELYTKYMTLINSGIRYEGLFELPVFLPESGYKRNLIYQQSFAHKDKGVDINLGLSALSDVKRDYEEYDDETNYNCPQTKQKGNTYIDNKEEKDKFSLRLMSYGGMDTYGDNTVNKPFGTQSQGGIEISSRWSYEERWVETLLWFRESDRVQFNADFVLSASEIKNFDFTKKKLIDRNIFFIKSFKVQLLRNSIAPVKAVMIKA